MNDLQIIVKGTHRWRTRVNLWLFWISMPWREEPIEYIVPVPSAETFFHAIGDIEIVAKLDPGGLVRGAISSELSSAAASNFILYAFQKKPFKIELVKGDVYQGTIGIYPITDPATAII